MRSKFASQQAITVYPPPPTAFAVTHSLAALTPLTAPHRCYGMFDIASRRGSSLAWESLFFCAAARLATDWCATRRGLQIRGWVGRGRGRERRRRRSSKPVPGDDDLVPRLQPASSERPTTMAMPITTTLAGWTTAVRMDGDRTFYFDFSRRKPDLG